MFLDPKVILAHLPFTSNERVGDFGAGSGRFTFAAAERLGSEGKVYAFDALPGSVETLQRDAAAANARIYALAADLNEHVPLKNNLLTLGIVANTLHQIRNRERFVREIGRVVAPGGKVLVVDWASSFKNMGPHADAVILPGDAARLFSGNGFSVGSLLPAGTHHYAFIAENTNP